MAKRQLLANPKAQTLLEETYIRVKIFQSANFLWDRVLTETEREQLGGDLDSAWRKRGTAGMWMHLHGVSAPRAVLDVARRINLLSEVNYHWLMGELGENVATSSAETRPHWNHIEGKLLYGKQVIRSVRINKSPTNVQIILDAFQAANCTTRIPNPLPHGQDQLHQALRTLNQNLKKIRFHGLEGAEAIRWALK